MYSSRPIYSAILDLPQKPDPSTPLPHLHHLTRWRASRPEASNPRVRKPRIQINTAIIYRPELPASATTTVLSFTCISRPALAVDPVKPITGGYVNGVACVIHGYVFIGDAIAVVGVAGCKPTGKN